MRLLAVAASQARVESRLGTRAYPRGDPTPGRLLTPTPYAYRAFRGYEDSRFVILLFISRLVTLANTS
jgi:hypothetical protein